MKPPINEEVLLERLKLFGAYFDSGFDYGDAIELQSFLDNVDSNDSGFYNVSLILKRVSIFICIHMQER